MMKSGDFLPLIIPICMVLAVGAYAICRTFA
jgi:hypothetical protein